MKRLIVFAVALVVFASSVSVSEARLFKRRGCHKGHCGLHHKGCNR